MSWRTIPGLETRFEVNEEGAIRSLPTRNSPGVIRKPNIDRNGYAHLTYHVPYMRGTKSILVHRAVALAFLPNPENKRVVNHIDSDRSNNALSNLEWATDVENVQHSFKHGQRTGEPVRGEKNPNARLSVSQVINIWHCRGAVTGMALAGLYGVDSQTIYDIWNGRRWKYLQLKAGREVSDEQ